MSIARCEFVLSSLSAVSLLALTSHFVPECSWLAVMAGLLLIAGLCELALLRFQCGVGHRCEGGGEERVGGGERWVESVGCVGWSGQLETAVRHVDC